MSELDLNDQHARHIARIQINAPVSAENYSGQRRMRFLESVNRIMSEDNCRLTRENAALRNAVADSIEYLEPRIGMKTESRGYALLKRLSAILIRKE